MLIMDLMQELLKMYDRFDKLSGFILIINHYSGRGFEVADNGSDFLALYVTVLLFTSCLQLACQ